MKVEEGGRELPPGPPCWTPGPVELPGRPGLGRNAMGRITTFPCNIKTKCKLNSGFCQHPNTAKGSEAATTNIFFLASALFLTLTLLYL